MQSRERQRPGTKATNVNEQPLRSQCRPVYNPPVTDPVAHRSVGAILLAAGTSSRMGGFKQLLPYRGSTIVETCVATVRGTTVDSIYVVVGHRADEVAAAVEAPDVRIVRNDAYLDGMATSVVAGVTAARAAGHDAVMICLCDQPHLDRTVYDAVLGAYRESGAPIVVPSYAGDTGHPAIFDRSLFDEILAVDPSQGLRAVTYAHRGDKLRVPVDAVGVLDDIDTAEDYERLR